MKITLTKATFYFNDPVNLTPYARTIDVDLATLDDSVVRKLNLGVVTGVIDIVEGGAEFKARVEGLVTKDQPAPVVEEVKEAPTEVKEEVQEPAKEEAEPKRKAPTPAKKTVAKKA